MATGISIIAHELPQEVGDFAILLHGGYSRRKALLLNTLSSLSTTPAAILAYWALEIIKINSQSLITNAQESKMNILASAVVFIGVLCSYFKVPYIEGGVGILLSLMLLQIGLIIGKIALFSLMDVSPSREWKSVCEFRSYAAIFISA